MAAVGSNPAALADRLQQIGPLTSYQIRKIKVNRIVELLYDPYLVLEKIGEGGMGKVYKAIQQRIGKLVALKVVRSQLMTNKVVLRRYKREAKAASELDHPNIVVLYDAGESAERHYLAMEYVEGSDLSRLLKLNGPLPYQEACEYIRQAALGLQHAHEKNFIHRDIKPSNLLVSGERALPGTDGKANLKILDMGLVRSLTETEDENSKSELTRDGTVVGTPDYMSPEQAKNSSLVDGRADVYSLGCTLFYLITGKPPFPDGSPIDKLLRHQLDPPPDLKKLKKELPPGLVVLVNKTLKKKPEDRYQTAGELAQALIAYTPTADADLMMVPVKALPDTLASPDPMAPITPAMGLRALGPGGSNIVPMAAAVVSPNSTPKPRQKRVLTPIRPAKPIPKPNVSTGAEPDSDSMPGTDSQAVKTRGNRRTPIRPISVRQPSTASARNTYVIAGAAGGIALLVALVAFAVSGRGSGTKSTGKPDGPPPEPIPSSVPISINTPATVAPAVLLPDKTVAALVIHPQPYWKRAAFDIKPMSHASETLRRLTNVFKYDPRQFDRIVIGWMDSKGEHFTATGEGDFATPAWKEGLKGVARRIAAGNVETQAPFQFRPDSNPLSRREPWGVLLGERAYLIGSEFAPTSSVAKRFADGAPAANLDPALIAVLPVAADPDPPLVTFVATGGWIPPHGKKLTDEKVKLLVLTARKSEETIDVQLTLTGSNKEALKDFVSLYLNTSLREKLPALKPFDDAFTGMPEWDLTSGQVRMKLIGSWPIHEIADWLDPLLPGGS